MCLTNGDNNFEKQLDIDSKPCSFKRTFAHLIKVSVTLIVTLSTERVPQGKILFNYTQ